jgi:hypothetical protein
MQEAGEGALVPRSSGVASEDEESSLESVLGVLLVPKYTPTYAHHHRSMPADQGGESAVVVVIGEGAQQLLVTLVAVALRGDHIAKVLNAGG